VDPSHSHAAIVASGVQPLAEEDPAEAVLLGPVGLGVSTPWAVRPHVHTVVGPMLAAVSGRVVAELIVGFSDEVSLIAGGHDLDNYVFRVAQRLGPERVAAIFGRKIHGPSSLAVGPAQQDAAVAAPQFSARIAGFYGRKAWKQELHDRLAAQASLVDPGTVEMKIAVTTGRAATGPTCGNRSSMPSALVLGEDPPSRSIRTMTA